MKPSDRTNDKLDELIRLMRIITGPKIKEFNEYIEEKFLNTKERKKMYELIDGETNIKEIAKKVTVSSEAVRVFVRDLEAAGLIQLEKVGSFNIPKRLV